MKLSSQILATLPGFILLFNRVVNAFEYEYPTYRFRPWTELTKGEKKAARDLGYNQASWNLPGTADVEYYAWYIHQDYYGDYDDYYPDRDFLDSAETLGFVDRVVDGVTQSAEDIWDCWQNHYYSYVWAELVEYDLDSYAEDLGWNENKWDDDDLEDEDKPASETKYWEELTDDEKTAALGFCYTQKIWDYQSLPYCLDSEQDAKVGKNLRSCHWVSENASRCNINKKGLLSIHCSNTCGSCDTYGCTDSESKFYWGEKSNGKILYKNCKYIDRKKKCDAKDGISKLTCPETCDLDGCV